MTVLKILILLVFVTLFLVALSWRRSVGFLRYFFYLRVSFLFGLLLFLLPLICTQVAPAMLENLSEMRNAAQCVAVMLCAVVLAKAVMTTGHVTLVRSKDRFPGLPRLPKSPWLFRLWDKPFFPRPRDAVAFVLAAPTAIWVIVNSRVVATPFVILVAFLAALAFVWLYRVLADLPTSRPAEVVITKILNTVGLKKGYINKRTQLVDASHTKAALFWLFATLIYILGFFIFAPNSSYETPALVPLLLLATVLCLLLAGLSYFLDYYRIPTLLSFVLLSIGSYLYWGTDHYYKLTTLAVPRDLKQDSDIQTALKNRLALQESQEKTLVLVATAGGGIQASAWTAKVLTELERSFGPSFSRSVGFVSSVSGGTVGSLFYVDQFNSEGTLQPETLETDQVFRNATQSNLDAIGWGLAYGDFWRLIGIPVGKFEDRGSALEDDWRHLMVDGEATLGSWREDVLSGIKPLTVFNATLVDTGERYLLSPLVLEEDFGRVYKSRDFNTLYPTYDINVRTAARLSASFPYVSPAARNAEGEEIYYAVDGGYFDNFGVFTTVNFLEHHVLPYTSALGIKNILVLEIRAFPNPPRVSHQTLLQPWLMQAANPLITLFSVRGSTQTARNFVELENLKQSQRAREQEDINVETLALVFPDWERTLPLSWKLKSQQVADLNEGWLRVKQNTAYQKLKTLWEQWHPRPSY